MTSTPSAAFLLLLWAAPVDPFVSEDGSFSIRFPGRPTRDVMTIPTPEGPQTRHVFHYSDKDLSISVFQACTPPPVLPSDPKEALDLARQEVLDRTGVTSLSERRIRVNGRPGREFVDELDGLKSIGRTVIGHDGVFFSVIASGYSPAGKRKAREALRSFSVHPPSARSLCKVR